ncbi:basic proline-rich protein-like [Suricata suricatta]|uniref:basic proline-rich protein-like n=1 Tax=Suricata suricatta TaxID=37032 RepID=UPI0011558353|nr:basic proline-rich protein-like [Suricata suricatta]
MFPHRPVSVHQEADFPYLPGDRKPPVPPHPSPPPLAHGEPVLPPPPPPPHLLAPSAVWASPAGVLGCGKASIAPAVAGATAAPAPRPDPTGPTEPGPQDA